MRIISICTTIIFLKTICFSAEVKDNGNLEKYFKKKNAQEYVTYKLKQKKYNKKQFADFMQIMNFSPQNPLPEDIKGYKKFMNSEKNAMYNEKLSDFFYIDNSVDHQTPISEDETVGLKEKAQDILGQFLKDDKNSFDLLSTSDVMWQNKEETKGSIIFKNFKFMKKLKGRVVIGPEISAHIRLGANENIQHVSIKYPDIVESKTIDRPVKKNRRILEKRLRMKAENKKITLLGNDEPVKVDELEVIHIYDSYVPIETENEILLKPNITMVCDNHLSNGIIIQEEIHFSEDENDISDKELTEILSEN